MSVPVAPCVLEFQPASDALCFFSAFRRKGSAMLWLTTACLDMVSETEMVLLLAFGVIMQPINHDKIFV